MMKSHNIWIFSLFIVVLLAGSLAAAEFRKVQSFRHGDQPGQLMWNAALSGGVPDGPFQGPMAFLTDKKGNLWVGDTLNGRIVGVSREGKTGPLIDLLQVGRQLGLATDVVLLDMVPGLSGKLLVADANNNAVIEIDLKGKSHRVFRSPPSGRGAWLQINRLHCDRKGRIFIEDLASMKTVVLTGDGSLLSTLEGELGLAVNAEGRAAMIVMDTADAKKRHVVISPVPGSPAEKIATLNADAEILWASVIGFDGAGRLTLVYDTEKARNYAVVEATGKISRTVAVQFIDPGYDPTRPDWVGPDGRIFTVRVTPSALEILALD